MDVQDDEALADDDRPVADGGLLKERKGLLGPKKEADYDYFVSDIWPRISSKEERQSMTAPLVWQVMLFALVWAALLHQLPGRYACWLSIGCLLVSAHPEHSTPL